MAPEQSGRLHPTHLRYRQRDLFARDVSGSAEIKAPIDAVWNALVDFERYGEWNPFTPKIETDLKVGSPVILHVDMPGRSKSIRTEWVNLVEPGRTICWGMQMGHAALLNANRWQILKELPGSRTQYLTVDYFSGLLTPLVMALYGQPTGDGFQSVADGLKAWVETETHK